MHPSTTTTTAGETITLYWWASGDEVTLNGDVVDLQASKTVTIYGQTKLELVASNRCGTPVSRTVVVNPPSGSENSDAGSSSSVRSTPDLQSASLPDAVVTTSRPAPVALRAARALSLPTPKMSPVPLGTPPPPLKAGTLLAQELEPFELSTALVIGVILLLIALPRIRPRGER